MADNNGKSISGRKVFFINPTIPIEKTVITRLQTLEYEVYALKDYRVARGLFASLKDGICYVCIDSGLTKEGWKNFLNYFALNDIYRNFDFGIISETLNENKKTEFAQGLKLTAGCLAAPEAEETVHDLVKALDSLSAKGMRRYVRVNCMEDKKADLYWFTNDKKMLRCKLVDLSTAGIAVMLPASQAKAVFMNQLITNATIVLAGKQLSISVKITGMKAANDILLVVMMYGMESPITTLNQIRSYVIDSLNADLTRRIKETPLDRTNYERDFR